MTHPATLITGTRGDAASGSAVDFSKLSVNFGKSSSSKSAADKAKPVLPTRRPVTTPARIAMGPGSIGMKPAEVIVLATTYLPEAEKLVDTTFSKWVTSTPRLKLKLWTPQELMDAGKKNSDSTFAFVDSAAPSTVNVSYKSPIFKAHNVNVDDVKALLLHEVLHTRSAAFALNIAHTFGVPLTDGKAARFSDGSLVRGITEGLTEIFTMEALNTNTTPANYGRETKWAGRLIDKVNIETATRAYFGNDVASMVQVKKAIEELVKEDKAAFESASARAAP